MIIRRGAVSLTSKRWLRCIKRAESVVHIAHYERERFKGPLPSNTLHNAATEAPVVPKECVALWDCVQIFVEEYYAGYLATFLHIFVLKCPQSVMLQFCNLVPWSREEIHTRINLEVANSNS